MWLLLALGLTAAAAEVFTWRSDLRHMSPMRWLARACQRHCSGFGVGRDAMQDWLFAAGAGNGAGGDCDGAGGVSARLSASVYRAGADASDRVGRSALCADRIGPAVLRRRRRARTSAFTNETFTLGGVNISGQSLLVYAFTAVLVVAMDSSSNTHYSAKRCAHDPPIRTGARLVGVSPNFAGSLSITLAAAIGAMSGLLIGPITTVYYDSGISGWPEGLCGAIVGGLAKLPDCGGRRDLRRAGGIVLVVFWASAYKGSDRIHTDPADPALALMTTHHHEENDMKPRVLVAATVAVIAAMPTIAPAFYVTLLNYIGLYSLVALGACAADRCGRAELRAGGRLSVSVYTTAVLTTQYGLSPWITLFIAIAITLVIGYAAGIITLSMGGHYLPLATIAWGISLYF